MSMIRCIVYMDEILKKVIKYYIFLKKRISILNHDYVKDKGCII